MKTEKILAITQLGLDYCWLTVITIDGTELTVYHNGLRWEVDDTQKEAEILILETDDCEEVRRSVIRGTKKTIENFMYSVGYGVSNKKSDSVYQHTVNELQNKMQSMLWEIQEMQQQLEEKE